MIKDNIKNAREAEGISKAELARRLHIKYSTYNGYETGHRKPPAVMLSKMAEVLSVPVDYLHHGVTKQMIKERYIYMAQTMEEKQLLSAFWKMNKTGRRRAIENVSDLAKIDDYTVQDVVDMFKGKGSLVDGYNAGNKED